MLMILGVAMVALTQVSCQTTTPAGLRFSVVEQTAGQVVLRRGDQTHVVRRGSDVVRVRGVPRYTVVERAALSWYLEALPAPAGDPVTAIREAAPGTTVVVPPGEFTGDAVVGPGVTVVGCGMKTSWLCDSIRLRDHRQQRRQRQPRLHPQHLDRHPQRAGAEQPGLEASNEK
jgi:hypothetical protein